jgi:hypothetical protein
LVVSPPRERPSPWSAGSLSTRPVLRVAAPPLAGPSGVLVGADDGGVHADVPGDQPARVGLGLQLGEDLLPGPIALPAPKQPIDGLPGPVAGRHIPPRRPPVRVRQRIPSISCRLLQVGGRPGFLPLGSNGSSLAHCSLVRSPRPMTGASHGTPWLLKHALAKLELQVLTVNETDRPLAARNSSTVLKTFSCGNRTPRPCASRSRCWMPCLCGHESCSRRTLRPDSLRGSTCRARYRLSTS